MAAIFESIGHRFESLSRRERILVMLMVGTAVALAIVLGVVFMARKVAEKQRRIEDNDRILLELSTKGEKLLEQKTERDRQEARYEREIPPLPGLLERLAGEAGIEIPELRELPDDPVDKKWVRKSVEVRLRRVGLKPVTDFMVKVENENERIPIAITHLTIKKRASEPDSYDVDITVSAYTKKSKKKKKRSAKEKKTGGDAEAGQKVPKSGQPVYGPQP